LPIRVVHEHDFQIASVTESVTVQNNVEEEMKAFFQRASGYQGDQMNLPVEDVDAAIPFYEKVMGFSVLSRDTVPHNSAILGRDDVQIGLVENGGDPTQDGSFFQVDNAELAFAELKSNGLDKEEANFSVEKHRNTFKVFYVVAPDGLCYCLGELQK
jgi:lactoylglutathione lyase